MEAQTLIKVWDLPLRIFHWLLVAGFFIAYLTEDDLLTVHVWAGYMVAGLLVFRLAWDLSAMTMPGSQIFYAALPGRLLILKI